MSFLGRPGAVVTGALVVIVTLAVVAVQRGAREPGSIDQMACGSAVAPYSQTAPEGTDLGKDGQDALDALALNLEGRGFTETYDYKLWSQDGGRLVLLGTSTGSDGVLTYSYANFELGEGEWTPTSWGGCSWEPIVEGYGIASWRLPNAEVDVSASKFTVVATELACANGDVPEGREVVQSVLASDSEITITVLVEAVRGAATCPGNPEFVFEIELDEPVGTRALLDGSETPPARRHDPLAAIDCRNGQVESGAIESWVFFRCGRASPPGFRRVRRPFGAVRTQNPAERALLSLLAGPTREELTAGYVSLFGPETADALVSATLNDDNGGLIVEFTEKIMANAATTLGEKTLLQIELLVNVFDTAEIDHVEFRIDGSCGAWSKHVGEDRCLTYTRDDLSRLLDLLS